jgi:PAS domain S-box-containing protein
MGDDDRVARIERQLAAAQAITHIGSWEWDARTNAVSWSDELYRIYGLEPRSRTIDFAFFVSCLVPEDRGRVQGEVGRALREGTRFAYEERIARPDGTVRVLDTIGEAARDAEGRVVGLIGTCRDVTEERKRDAQVRLFADLVTNVQIGLSVWQVDDPSDARGVRLLAFNPAAESIHRGPLGPCVGLTLAEIAPYAAGGTFESMLLRVARDHRVLEEHVLGSRNPDDPTRSISIKAFPLPGRCVGVAIEDITEPTLVKKQQAAEQRVLERIAEGAPLADVLTELTLAIEELAPPAIGSILLVDDDAGVVRHGAAPHLPADYVRAIDGQHIGPKAGSCGTAAYEKRPVFVDDVETDPRWESYRAIARTFGLRACWSLPVMTTEGRVLGTFAIYHRAPRAPGAREIALLERMAHLAGIAIERRELEDQLRALTAHLESVREDERTGIAREIHDELGQALTALKMDLAWIARRMQGGGEVPRDAVLEKVRGMSAMTDDVIEQVRRISAELRPGVLDDLGLVAAIEWQASEFEKRTGLVCAVRASVPEAFHPSRELSTALFRIFQEALTNVARHAEASRVDVFLEARDGAVTLDVRDDGKGIAPDATRSRRSLGLLGIRERARRLGGTAAITRAEPGTRVSVAAPLGSAT